MFDYVHLSTPTRKIRYGGRRKLRGLGGVGIWVKLYPRVIFYFSFFIFLVTSTHAQQSLISVDFCFMHPKTCFGGGVFLRGCFDGWLNLLHFTPKIFSMGRLWL